MSQATAEAHAALQLATQPMDSHLSHMAAKRRLQSTQLNDTSASNPNPEWVTAWESQIKHVQDTFSNFQQTLKNTEPLVSAMPHPVENPTIKPENPDAYKLGKLWNATIHEFLAQSVIGWIFDKAMQGQTKPSGRRLHESSSPVTDQNQLAMASSMTNVLNTLLAIATTFDGPGNDVEFPLEYLLDPNGEGPSARRLLNEQGPGNQHHDHPLLDKLRADWDKTIESMRNFHAGAKLKTAENDVAAKATGLKKRFEDLQTRIKSHFEGSHRHLLSEKLNHEPAPEEAASGNSLYVMPPVTKTTVVMLMPQREFNDSAAYVQDVLGFLTNFISSAFAPLSPVTTTRQGFSLERPHSTRRVPHPPAQEDAAIAVQRRKRQLLSRTEEYINGGNNDKYYYEEFEQDDAYDGYDAEDDAWMWGNDDNEWVNGQVEGDEALYSETPTMPSSMELVIRLLTPTENGVVSPELINLLSDPEGATLAQVLTEMSMAPAGSELVFSNSPAKDVSSEATGPRLPLFGPSVKVGPAQSASSISSSQSLEEERRKAAQRQAVAELVIKPLKGPTTHNNGDSTPILMDARWWGVALGLGGMGLLLVATALSGMKP